MYLFHSLSLNINYILVWCLQSESINKQINKIVNYSKIWTWETGDRRQQQGGEYCRVKSAVSLSSGPFKYVKIFSKGRKGTFVELIILTL